MRRLGELLSGDLTGVERKEFLLLGTEFLSALASELALDKCFIFRNETSIVGYSGQLHMEGTTPDGLELAFDLEQNYLTFRDEQSCLYCRPKNAKKIRLSNCTAVSVPQLQNGDYPLLLSIFKSKYTGGEQAGYDAA